MSSVRTTTSPTALAPAGDVATVARSESRLRSWHWNVASLLTAVVTWAVVVAVFQPPAYVLPSPMAVVARLVESRELLVESAAPTIGVVLAGFFLGLLVAVPFGMLIVAVPALDKLVYPLVVAFNSIPKVALAPLFVVWFGYGATPRVVITFSIAFFPILVNTVTGLRSVDPDMVRLARSMGGSTARVFLRIRLPHSLPSIFAGTKVATSLAVIGAIIGEFVASDDGWGYLLIQAQGQLDTTLIFAILILLAVFATLLYYAVELVERLVTPWQASQRTHD